MQSQMLFTVIIHAELLEKAFLCKEVNQGYPPSSSKKSLSTHTVFALNGKETVSISVQSHLQVLYTNDVLSTNNPEFENYLGQMYPAELDSKDTTESITSVSRIDLLLSIERNDLETPHFHFRQTRWFQFPRHKLSVPDSNIPSSPAYDVFISQPIRHARACSSYECFSYSNKDIFIILLNAWNQSGNLMYGWCGILFTNMKYPSHECCKSLSVYAFLSALAYFFTSLSNSLYSAFTFDFTVSDFVERIFLLFFPAIHFLPCWIRDTPLLFHLLGRSSSLPVSTIHVKFPSLGGRLPLFNLISLLNFHLPPRSGNLPLFEPHFLRIIFSLKEWFVLTFAMKMHC